MEELPDYLRAVLDAARLSGRSEREISRMATGQAAAISQIKLGRIPSSNRLLLLCEALGLEFYIGPPRSEAAPADTDEATGPGGSMAVARSDEENPPAWAEELSTSLRDDMATVLRELAPADELLVSLREVQENLGTLQRELPPEDQAPGEQAVKSPDDPALIDASGLFHFKGESEEEVSDLVHYIGAVRELKAAAGGGAMVLDETVTARIPFRRDWLRRHSLQADLCNIIHVAGESMEPTLPDGCSILVDRSRKRRRARHIYVLITDDGLVVKRLDKDEADDWQLVSDHPAWKPAPWLRGTEIIGQVRWMARTL